MEVVLHRLKSHSHPPHSHPFNNGTATEEDFFHSATHSHINRQLTMIRAQPSITP